MLLNELLELDEPLALDEPQAKPQELQQLGLGVG